MYFRARHYDAALGQFIQRDPIGFAAGDLNLYAYTWNDPYNWTDPSGLASTAASNNAAATANTAFVVTAIVTAGVLANADTLSDYLSNIDLDLNVVQAKKSGKRGGKEHKKGKRKSTTKKHEDGIDRKGKDYGGEKGDTKRGFPRRPPDDHKGPWPPKPKKIPVSKATPQTPSPDPHKPATNADAVQRLR
jgi:uncharacterized protein RhaS with RHS repeats